MNSMRNTYPSHQQAGRMTMGMMVRIFGGWPRY